MLKPTVVSTKKQLVLGPDQLRQVLNDQGLRVPKDFKVSAHMSDFTLTDVDTIEIIYDEVPVEDS